MGGGEELSLGRGVAAHSRLRALTSLLSSLQAAGPSLVLECYVLSLQRSFLQNIFSSSFAEISWVLFFFFSPASLFVGAVIESI